MNYISKRKAKKVVVDEIASTYYYICEVGKPLCTEAVSWDLFHYMAMFRMEVAYKLYNSDVVIMNDNLRQKLDIETSKVRLQAVSYLLFHQRNMSSKKSIIGRNMTPITFDTPISLPSLFSQEEDEDILAVPEGIAKIIKHDAQNMSIISILDT